MFSLSAHKWYLKNVAHSGTTDVNVTNAASSTGIISLLNWPMAQITSSFNFVNLPLTGKLSEGMNYVLSIFMPPEPSPGLVLIWYTQRDYRFGFTSHMEGSWKLMSRARSLSLHRQVGGQAALCDSRMRAGSFALKRSELGGEKFANKSFICAPFKGRATRIKEPASAT